MVNLVQICGRSANIFLYNQCFFGNVYVVFPISTARSLCFGKIRLKQVFFLHHFVAINLKTFCQRVNCLQVGICYRLGTMQLFYFCQIYLCLACWVVIMVCRFCKCNVQVFFSIKGLFTSTCNFGGLVIIKNRLGDLGGYYFIKF